MGSEKRLASIVNSKIFARTLFLRIALKDSSDVKNLRLGHN